MVEGAQASFKIVKVDGYDANKKLQGVKFKVFCENPDVDFGGGQKELILVTDENGEITFDGDAYTFYFDEVYHVQEVEAPEDYGTISFDYLVTLTNMICRRSTTVTTSTIILTPCRLRTGRSKGWSLRNR